MDGATVSLVEGAIKIIRAYVFAGLLFSAIFLIFGVHRVDPDASGWRLGFRLVIIPGLCVFWPLFAVRWIRGQRQPPERNAHRLASQKY